MNPALSVVFFTTLAGAGQGLLLALVAAEWSAGTAGSTLPLAPGFAAAARCSRPRSPSAGRTRRELLPPRPPGARLARRDAVAHLVAVARGHRAARLHRAGARLRRRRGHGRIELALALGALAALAAPRAVPLLHRHDLRVHPLPARGATPLTPLNFLLLGCANGLTLASALGGSRGAVAAALLRHRRDRHHARRPRQAARRPVAQRGLEAEVDAADGDRHQSTRASSSARRASWAARSTRASSSIGRSAGACAALAWQPAPAPSRAVAELLLSRSAWPASRRPVP